MTHERIEINPQIMFGKPVVKGTRITVEQILRKLAGGMTVSEIIADHPHLTPEDIYAAAAQPVHAVILTALSLPYKEPNRTPTSAENAEKNEKSA